METINNSKVKRSLATKCVIGFIGTLFFGAIVLSALTQINAYTSLCAVGDDTCIITKMQSIRDWRDGQQKVHNDAVLKIEEDTKQQLTSLKKMMSAGGVAKQAQEGKLENVDPDLLGAIKKSLTFVPQALAENDPNDESKSVVNTTFIEPQVSISQNAYAPNRYQAILAKVGSPYANIPIDQYCSVAGVDVKHCDMLLGIAQAESQNGKDFTSITKSKKEAITLGQTYYFNPVGLTDLSHYKKGVNHKVPDTNGFYLKKFDSWESFWSWFPGFMKDSDTWKLLDKSRVGELNSCWKHGNACGGDEDEWSDAAQGFINKI